MSNLRGTTVSVLAALSLFACEAAAEPVYGLVSLSEGTVDTSPMYLDRFDTATPGTATTFASNSQLLLLQGVVPGQTIRSIDFRPADGLLYAVGLDATTGAQLYTVNLSTGVLTTVGGGFTLAGNGSQLLSIDFNPVADQLRIVTGSGNNYRLEPNNGALVADATVDPDNSQVDGLAYSNNVAGATSTTLYGYDYLNDQLDTIGSVGGTPTSPNSGTSFVVGSSGLFSYAPYIGFDIDQTGLAFGNIDGVFYSVDLTSGLFTQIGADAFSGTLDIAIQTDAVTQVTTPVPEPGSLALVVLGLTGLAKRLRRRSSSAD